MSITDHEDSIEGLSPDCENLSLFFARIITSKHNQHVLVRITGKAGRGKSWFGLSLAYGVAQEVAKIKNGNPEDYFTMENDLGVISKAEIKRVMENPKPHTIKFLDDVAVAWNARKYKDEFNIDMNDLIQTFRPNHNLVIMTLQSGFLVDKVPRSLIHYQIEMDENFFDYGISTVKVFKLDLDENSGKTYRHYLMSGGITYKRHLGYAPIPEIAEAYEIERAKQLKRMNEAKDQDKKNGSQPLKKHLVPIVDKLISAAGWTQEEACSMLGLTPRYYRDVKGKEGTITDIYN